MKFLFTRSFHRTAKALVTGFVTTRTEESEGKPCLSASGNIRQCHRLAFPPPFFPFHIPLSVCSSEV